MPAYVTPDSHDQLVYTLDESGSPWANTGAAGALDLTARAAGPASAAGLFNNGVALPGPYNSQKFLTTGDTSLGASGAAISVSCWVNFTDYQSGQPGTIFSKEYHTQGGTWTNPAIGLGYYGNNHGLLSFGITIAGTFYSYNANAQGKEADVPLSGWHHVALTWDGYTVCIYLDGLQTDARVPIAGLGNHSIDFGTGGPWTFGGDDSDTQAIHGSIDDIRVADIARDANYFAAMAYPDYGAELQSMPRITAFPSDVITSLDLIPQAGAAAAVGGNVNFPTNYRKFNHGLDTP